MMMILIMSGVIPPQQSYYPHQIAFFYQLNLRTQHCSLSHCSLLNSLTLIVQTWSCIICCHAIQTNRRVVNLHISDLLIQF